MASTATTDALKSLLADSYALLLRTHNSHWNVRGPNFKALHDLFEEQYRELFEAVDEIAERIRILGDIAPGGLSTFRDMTSIPDGDGTETADQMIQGLIAGHDKVLADVVALRKTADQAGDEATVDLANARQGVHDKARWMLASSLSTA